MSAPGAPEEQPDPVRRPSVGVPAERRHGERRVALTPAAVGSLDKLGLAPVVEAGAGLEAGYPDSAYAERGATLGSRQDALAADVVAMVRVAAGDPASPDLERLSAGQIVVGMAAPLAAPDLAAAVAATGATLFSLELLPRTTRAQPMDVLSSQASVAGYKAVLIAADALPKMFPMMTTAAGTLAPARVFVVGAGVAGLAAIAAARRLGAVVEAYDVRPAVKEEVQSLGARFVEIELETGQEGSGSGAYAARMTEETLRRQRELMTRVVASSDVVITTAQVQGARAPVLVTVDMVAGMAPGSVIVDLAASQGGNCELSRPDETVEVGGVRIVGAGDLAATIPHHASQLYGKNLANFIQLLVDDGRLVPPEDDDIVRETMVTSGGSVVHPRVREALGEPRPPEPEEAQAPHAEAPR
ncbi:MAG TPA: NAD(P) transhydrogenase subunit alpha [Miltoncostaeaceae bacterium]|nr:NAD(P) transhydrogenase subunit alpha [Miltoncostaeaceae bacterium]